MKLLKSASMVKEEKKKHNISAQYKNQMLNPTTDSFNNILVVIKANKSHSQLSHSSKSLPLTKKKNNGVQYINGKNGDRFTNPITIKVI